MESNSKRRLSDESFGSSVTSYKIPKRIKRCGECPSCTMVDCGTCTICNMNSVRQGSTKYTCLAKDACQRSESSPEKNGAKTLGLSVKTGCSPVKPSSSPLSSPLKTVSPPVKDVCPTVKTVSPPSKTVSPPSKTVSPLSNTALVSSMLALKTVNSPVKKEDSLSKMGSSTSPVTKTPRPIQPAPPTQRREDSPSPGKRCGSCMGCLRTKPCLSCFNCKGGKMESCLSLICTELQKNNILQILQAKMKKDASANGVNLESFIAPLKSTSPPKSESAEKKHRRGRQPLSESEGPAAARCKTCSGCLRTEKCGTCSGCNRQTFCARMKCKAQIRANNERQKAREAMEQGIDVSPSPSPAKVTVKEPSTKPRKSTESWCVSPSKSIGLAPISSNEPVIRCWSCPGCLLTEACKECSMCQKGSKDCVKRRCQKTKTIETPQASLRQLVALNQLANLNSALTSPSRGSGSSTPGTPKSPGTPGTPPTLVSPWIVATPKTPASTPETPKTPGTPGTPKTAGILGIPKTATGTPVTPGTSIKDPFYQNSAQLTKKIKPIKTKRCGVCKECTSGVNCGNCGFCKSGKPELVNRCPAKLCKSRVQVTPRGPRCKNPIKAKRLPRCGECTGCLAEECNDCDNCIKKAKGEFLRCNQVCVQKKCLKLAAIPKAVKKKMKRQRCGKCSGCKMREGCGKCSHCLKVSVKLCTERRCKDPIITEVIPREPKDPKLPKEQVVKPKKVPTAPKGRRCQECDGCKADPCGECNACQKTPDLCKARECTNRLLRGAGGGLPKQKSVNGSANKRGCNPRRYKRCGKCDGCKMEDCGECQSCRHNQEYADQMLAKATCLAIVCDDPIDLYGASNENMKEQEDGTCPTKVILGKLYDFRCYFCKVLPRVGSANRSELYRHYSLMHYTSELSCEFGKLTRCPLCHKDLKGSSYISHMGQVHDEVHKYLPEAAKIPRKVQGSKGNRGHHRKAVFVRKRFIDYDFPDIPDGFDQNGEDRRVEIALPEPEPIIIDGFAIEQDVDEDEPLVVSREETVKLPDYRSGARCIICKSVFSDIKEAVLHIHNNHNIKGGCHNIMLDGERLLKAGYMALCYGETTTSLTEKGREVVTARIHKAFRSVPPKGWVKLTGTGLPNDTILPDGPLVTYDHLPVKEEDHKENIEKEQKMETDIDTKTTAGHSDDIVTKEEAPSNDILYKPSETSLLVT